MSFFNSPFVNAQQLVEWRSLRIALLALAFLFFQTLSVEATPGEGEHLPADETLSQSGRVVASMGAPALPASPASLLAPHACTAPAPTLLAPVGGATSNDLELPAFQWDPVSNISEYIVQISATDIFTRPLVSSSAIADPGEDVVFGDVSYDLEPDSTYYWRVASVCADGQIGPFSAPAVFATGGAGGGECDLPPPVLLRPVDGMETDSLIPMLTWAVRADAYEYQYELSTDAGFDELDENVTFYSIRRSEEIGRIPNENLVPGQLYYWRVASVCAEIDTMGEFSEAFTFRVTKDDLDLPTVPTPVSPAQGATTGSIRVVFDYSAVTGAEGYSIDFYRSHEDAVANSWFRSRNTLRTSEFAVFNPDESIFWRVQARNAYGWGELSAIRSFKTPVAEADAMIDAASGGVLEPDPGYLKVEVPAGAVTQDTMLHFQLLGTPQQPLPKHLFANRAFTLAAFADGTPLTELLKPFTMTIHYDENDLVAAGISDPSQLNLFFWTGERWESILPCEGCSLDTLNNRIVLKLNALAEFALAAPGVVSDGNRLFLPVVRP